MREEGEKNVEGPKPAGSEGGEGWRGKLGAGPERENVAGTRRQLNVQADYMRTANEKRQMPLL